MVAVAVITGVLATLVWVVGGMLAVLLVVSCIPIRVTARVDDIDVHQLMPETADTVMAAWEPAADEPARQTFWTAEASWMLGLVRFKSRGGPGQVGTAELNVLSLRRDLQADRGDRGEEPQKARDEGRRKASRMGQRGRQHQDRKKRDNRSRRSRPDLAEFMQMARAIIQETPGLVLRLWRSLALRIRGDLTYGFEDPFLTGMSQAVLANVSLPADLRLTPEYSDGCLKGWVEATATLYPIKTIGIVLGTALRPALRQLWWPRLRSAMRLTRAA